MIRHIVCPACGETEELSGKPIPTGYRPVALDADAATDPDDRDIRPR